MKRKFLGLFLLLSFVAVLGACSGNSSSSSDDECLDDPNADICKTIEDEETPEDAE